MQLNIKILSCIVLVFINKLKHLRGCRMFAALGGYPFGVKPGGISFNRGWKPWKWFNGADAAAPGIGSCGGRYEL